MKSPSPPPAPDPVKTASAQGAANTQTAIASQTLNMVDQYTPDGSLVYKQIGSVKVPNGLGGYNYVPRYKATQSLSDQQKALKGVNDVTEMNLATIGRDQSKRIGGLLGKPVDLSNEATEARLMELGSKRLDPRFAREEEALRTRLANSGIKAGSAAYDAEMSQFGQGRNDAYNSLLLTGRAQAVQEALAERNQPINEITALLSGSQVSQPNFVGTPSTPIAGVDYQGAVRDKYNADMQAWQAKVNNQNAMMGGLFGLAAAPFQMFSFSDRRLKTDIKKIGKLDNGLKLYSYRYKGDDTPQVGVMAQEVEKVKPSAVATHESGYKMVDYAQAVEG